MKKNICLILVLLLLLTGCGQRIEYDAPQGEPTDMSSYDLESDNFYEITIPEFIELTQQEKTCIVFCGYIACPWCQELAPVLDEVASEKEMKIYYINVYRDDNIEQLQQLIDYCQPLLHQDEEGDYVMYFPSIVYVQQGNLFDIHEGTVSGHDATVAKMTEKQRARLVYNLEKEFDDLLIKENG